MIKPGHGASEAPRHFFHPKRLKPNLDTAKRMNGWMNGGCGPMHHGKHGEHGENKKALDRAPRASPFVNNATISRANC